MTRNRILVAAAVLAAVVAGTAVWGLRFASQRLHGAIAQALGPRASIGNVELGWSGLTLTGLRIASGPGWPAADELRAARVQVTPDLRSLLGGPWRVRTVRVDGAYLSLLRTRDGRLRVLPALLERPRSADAKDAGHAASVLIGLVSLNSAAVDFFDASVRQPAHRLRLDRLNADVGPIALPALDRAMQIELDGVFKGPQRDGSLRLNGTLSVATRDAQLQGRLQGVDLIALQPYLLKAAEAGVQRGTLDLAIDAKVERNRLRAPGTLTLSGLELASGGAGSVLGTFAGVPRQTVLAAMSRNGRIDVKFTLEGRLDDPKFSLNETFALRMGAGLAESLGVSLSGVVEGVGGVLKGLFGK